MWLERELLIAPSPEQDRDWVFLTERGRAFLDHPAPLEWTAAELLLREHLDPEVAADIGPPFRQGKFTRAVGLAFLRVELRVRALAGIGESRVQPVDLMAMAFKDDGPLRDPGEGPAEAKAVRELFQGAMGRFRNPHLHEQRSVNSPGEAIRRIQLADLLLALAEAHARAHKAQASPP